MCNLTIFDTFIIIINVINIAIITLCTAIRRASEELETAVHNEKLATI